MAQKIVKPWLPDDRPNDERLADFFARDENSVEWKLMRAWDDVLDAVARHQQNVVGIEIKDDANRQTDALTAGWIRDIAARIGALPTKSQAQSGVPTREDLLDAAHQRLAGAYNDKPKLARECEALRQESHRRLDVPLRKLLDEFKQEITRLSVSETVKAGYLRDVVAGVERLMGPRLADAVTLTSGVTKADANNDAREESDYANLQEWQRVADTIACDFVATSPSLGRNKEVLANKVHAEMVQRSESRDKSVHKRGGKRVPTVETVRRRGLLNFGKYGMK